MEGKIVGAVIALIGLYALVRPNNRFSRFLKAEDSPLLVKRITAIGFIFIGVYVILGS